MTAQTDREVCRGCEVLSLRLVVATRVVGEIALVVDQPLFRERIVDHISARWAHQWDIDKCAKGFDAFFRSYIADVERDIDPAASDPSWERHRVWTNHASMLGEDWELVVPRRIAGQAGNPPTGKRSG